MTRDVEHRLRALEVRNRRLSILLAALLAVTAAGFATLVVGEARADGRVVRAEQVVIEDASGVVRARLGSHLPDAVFDGQRIDRPTSPSGLLLYDRNGHERGGYVTFDNGNVLLTLDAGRAGGNRQTAYFMADSAGATALRIWNRDGDQVALRANSGGARVNAVEDGRLIFQMPEITDPASTEMCRELRSLRERAEMERLMDACRKRMSEEGCRLCLGGE